MFLLAYAVRHTIQVYRLSKYSTEEFITVYPTDPPRDWPVVTLIAEDDRHYNIPVRVCEETSLWETYTRTAWQQGQGVRAAPQLAGLLEWITWTLGPSEPSWPVMFWRLASDNELTKFSSHLYA